jgi:hypothetical protein
MRPLPKLPPQILRIVLLAAGIVVVYLAARSLLTPSTFGQFGFYRGAALAEAASREPVYAGMAACAECHEEEVQKLKTHGHKTLSCEGCHGPGQEHVSNPDVKLQILNYSHCVRCHDANPSRPRFHKQIVTKDHYPGSNCTECHAPHMPEEVP